MAPWAIVSSLLTPRADAPKRKAHSNQRPWPMLATEVGRGHGRDGKRPDFDVHPLTRALPEVDPMAVSGLILLCGECGGSRSAMRLEPVYLLGPKPQPPTRRAFLLFASGFAGGTLLGGACGYSLGATRHGTAAAPDGASGPAGAGQAAAGAEELPSSGDARLDALRRLAVKAPIEELVAVWMDWWGEFDFNYQQDPVLWQGVDRLAQWAVEHPEQATRPMLGVLAQVCKSDKRPGTTRLKELEPELRRIHKTKPR